MIKKEIKVCMISWDDVDGDVLMYLAKLKAFKPLLDFVSDLRVYYRKTIKDTLEDEPEYPIKPGVKQKVEDFLSEVEGYEVIFIDCRERS